MFPFQSGELSFQISNNLENTNNNTNPFITTPTPTTTLTQHHPLLQPPPHSHPPNYSTNNLISTPKTRKGRSKSTPQHVNNNANNTSIVDNNNKNNGNDVAKNKKIIHREIERQRRQEMSDLHSSLRSLLPLDYVKGKRSICDHVTEATRYIQDLEKNIKMLGEKRDKLKAESTSSSSSSENLPIKRDFRSLSSSITTITSASVDYNVSIQKLSTTLQIEIAAGVAQEDPYPLSKALKVLDDEGLNVVSSFSSKVNQRWIHVIYCEDNDVTSVDTGHLQEKLMSVW